MDILTRKQEDTFLFTRTALSQEDSRNHSFTAFKPESSLLISHLNAKPLVPITDAEIRSRMQWKHTNSSHFSLSFDANSFQPKEAEILLHQLEDIYHHTFQLIHETFHDRLVVYATSLHSPSLMGRTARTHFNVAERAIYVVRHVGEDIESDLSIAVAHAMRFGKYLKHYGITRGWAILEDGFAVFLAERMSRDKVTFPFFGIDSDFVAHYLKERQVVRSLSHVWTARAFATSLERHAIAGAFLLYLGDVMGDDKIVAFSKHTNEVTSATFQTYFGGSLDALEERWTEHLPRTLNAHTSEEHHEMLTHWHRSAQGKF